MGLWILVLLIAVPFILWGIIDPRGAWQATESWKFRDPDANEPSDAAYAVSRVVGVITLIGFVVAGIVAFKSSHDDDPPESSRPYTAPTFTTPRDEPPTFQDLGPGTIIGYRYPSELTLEFVALQGQDVGWARCSTSIDVYEHTNAIVVSVRRSYTTFNGPYASIPSEVSDTTSGPCETDELTTVTRKLNHPVGKRPILTAAPFAAPSRYGLALGPRVRPKPRAEDREPDAEQDLGPVKINPTWKPVPLLARTHTKTGGR